jgi:pyrroline-5-carboxylate reductase
MKNIGVIGTGNIGSRLISLLCRNGSQNHLTVTDKDFQKGEILADKHEICFESIENTIQISDIIFLTVKPDQIKPICQTININSYINDQKTIVSVAAGISLESLSNWTDKQHRVVRCMPNLPICNGDGTILWYGNTKDIHPYKCEDYILLDLITQGPTSIWVDSEKLIDAGTIVSGCTPAHIAKIYGIYLEISKDLGFTETQSKLLLHNSFVGTMKLLADTEYDKIIKEVASKGGVTEKGLEIMDNKLRHIILKSITYSMDQIEIMKNKNKD